MFQSRLLLMHSKGSMLGSGSIRSSPFLLTEQNATQLHLWLRSMPLAIGRFFKPVMQGKSCWWNGMHLCTSSRRSRCTFLLFSMRCFQMWLFHICTSLLTNYTWEEEEGNLIIGCLFSTTYASMHCSYCCCKIVTYSFVLADCFDIMRSIECLILCWLSGRFQLWLWSLCQCFSGLNCIQIL